MRIACVGGGPAGLFLALLLARTGRHDVRVFERDRENASYGFGVVFSRLSAARLRAVAPDVVEEILSHGVRWQDVAVRAWNGAEARSSGHAFGAVERQAMLRVLRKHAVAAGVHVVQPAAVTALSDLHGYDLVVAADGAGSSIRQELAAELNPTVHYGATRYAWFGVERRFDCMTFLMAQGPHGPLGAHVYPYSSTHCTFLVEAPLRVWRDAGFASGGPLAPGATDPRALRYCEDVFARDLGGARLIGNGSRWLEFSEVRNAHWSWRNVVLIGDAAHTAHFSVGCGTSTAMEDAAELARCLSRFELVPDALRAYEAARKPVVANLQASAWASSQTWASLEHEAGRDAGEILLRLLTRTAQTDLDLLDKLDKSFAQNRAARQSAPLVAAELSSQAPSEPCTTLVSAQEIEALSPERASQSAALALVVSSAAADPRATAAALKQLRSRARERPVGIFVLANGSTGPAGELERWSSWLATLRELAPLDLVAIGSTRSDAAASAVQMLLCELVRSKLQLPAIYACPQSRLSHARTHVAAARADRIWITRSTP